VRLVLLNANVHYHEVNVPEYPLFHYQPYELALSSKLLIWSNYIRLKSCMYYAIPHAYAGYIQADVKSEGIKIPMLLRNEQSKKTIINFLPT
jgi:hypothetical protein